MVDFCCRFFTVYAEFFTVYKGHKRWKKTSPYWWSFSRLAFHGLPPLEQDMVYQKRGLCHPDVAGFMRDLPDNSSEWLRNEPGLETKTLGAVGAGTILKTFRIRNRNMKTILSAEAVQTHKDTLPRRICASSESKIGTPPCMYWR